MTRRGSGRRRRRRCRWSRFRSINKRRDFLTLLGRTIRMVQWFNYYPVSRLDWLTQAPSQSRRQISRGTEKFDAKSAALNCCCRCCCCSLLSECVHRRHGSLIEFSSIKLQLLLLPTEHVHKLSDSGWRAGNRRRRASFRCQESFLLLATARRKH